MHFNMKIAARGKIWFTIMIIAMLLSFGSMMFKGFNLGIDFTGGTILDLKFSRDVSVEEVRDVLKEFSLENSIIQHAGVVTADKAPNIVVRTYPIEDEQLRQNIMKTMTEKIAPFEVLRMEKVGATVGDELTKQAALALALSWLLMIAYITYRFEINFAISGLVCLMQDVILVLGVFSFLQMEIDSSFIAALLTVVGYSINGTIVIFDRIRENLRSYRKSDGLVKLIDDSINQTITRTIYTVSTVLFATVSVYLFGGETLKHFTLAMTIGFVSGTITSIFLAGPIWLMLRNRKLSAD